MRMIASQGRTVLLAASLLFVLTACSGTDGAAGPAGANGTNGTNGTNGIDGAPGTPGGTTLPAGGLVVAVQSVANVGAIATVKFTLADAKGQPVDVAGVYSVNGVIKPRFALAKITKDAAGSLMPLTVLTARGTPIAPTAFDPSSTGQGTLVDDGTRSGKYTYSFPASVVISSTATETHQLWVQASRQSDVVNVTNPRTFLTVNKEYSFIPAGSGTIQVRELVTTAACNKCHDGFKPESSTAVGGFHGYGRIEGPFCNVCHNPGRTSNPSADSSVFVHRIHNGWKLQSFVDVNRTEGSQVDPSASGGFKSCSVSSPCVCTVELPCSNEFHRIVATYPQDPRNCAACHGGAAQGEQIYSRPNRLACASCHDYVVWDGTAGLTSDKACKHPPTLGTDGKPVLCEHGGDQLGGANKPDSGCAGCHAPANIKAYHVPGVIQTNGTFLPGAGITPAGGSTLAFVIANVLVEDNGNPSMNFKLVKNGTDVVFNTPASTTSTVMMNGFTGTSRVYFTFGAPQDGIVAPNDFNYSANIDLVNAWNQSLDTTTASFTGPVNGYYKLTAKTVFVPATDTILTGAIGLSATFVESGVAGYPGGLQVVVDNVGKTAIGKAGRRPIVDNARCLDCHAQLGIGPTFHSGGRNDGVLCAVCHTPNRTSSGWSASSRSFVHAIHAARFREVPFNWTSTTNVALYGEVEFPNRVNNCVSCHLPGTYAFSGLSEATMASIPYLTVATGNLVAATNAVSPYAVGTVYGSGYSYNAATAAGVVTAAQGNTLVTSPITAACVSCHDSSPAYSHMELNGGMFYNWRSSMPGQFGVQESCMVCHGAGSIADIKAVHGQ